ncbi:hypothetical protein A1OW_10370 [Enterovibrio norvegicus]|uniref:hypothetical protein n=1 Tax=Enterovibrio norvegicus TaxID=188144 RepID=UPI0002DC0579|nr:hypothetical protein [Enterovibrio norvegicus]OEF50997.1 hypothetical protein A1OW_10370 [Enterovibrio norvegicus]
MIFSSWVDSKFGPRGIKKAADALGEPYKTVLYWYHLDRWPRVEKIEVIVAKAEGAIDLDAWRRAFLKRKHSQNGKKTTEKSA